MEVLAALAAEQDRDRGDEAKDGKCLVFRTGSGNPLSAGNVRRDFRKVLARARRVAKDWTPRELRHSFVSLLSADDIPIEDISQLVGHTNTVVTETVYRKQLHPVIQGGATAMNDIFPAGLREA